MFDSYFIVLGYAAAVFLLFYIYMSTNLERMEMFTYDSKEKAFVVTTIAQQHAIAVQVRDINNKRRLLFRKGYCASDYVMYGRFRVEVNSEGEEAIMSTGAQRWFTVNDYYGYVADFPDVALIGDAVYLLEK